MKEELEKRIELLKKELDERRWGWERPGYKEEVQEALDRLELLYMDLYSIV